MSERIIYYDCLRHYLDLKNQCKLKSLRQYYYRMRQYSDFTAVAFPVEASHNAHPKLACSAGKSITATTAKPDAIRIGMTSAAIVRANT